jgi:hypothetical protein
MSKTSRYIINTKTMICAGRHRIIDKRNLDIKKITTAYWSQKNVGSLPTK